MPACFVAAAERRFRASEKELRQIQQWLVGSGIDRLAQFSGSFFVPAELAECVSETHESTRVMGRKSQRLSKESLRALELTPSRVDRHVHGVGAQLLNDACIGGDDSS